MGIGFDLEPWPRIVPDVRRTWLRPALLIAGASLVVLVAQMTGVQDRFVPSEARAALSGIGLWAPVAAVAAFVVRPFLLLPVTPLWILAGMIFGWTEGFVVALAGTSAGAAVGFWLARGAGRDLILRRFGERAGRLASLHPADAFGTVVALQLTPIMPHDLINGLAGVSRMSYGAFFLASLVGTIPIIAVYTYFGQAVWSIPSRPFWIAVGALTALTALMLLFNGRRIRHRWMSSAGKEAR